VGKQEAITEEEKEQEPQNANLSGEEKTST